MRPERKYVSSYRGAMVMEVGALENGEGIIMWIIEDRVSVVHKHSCVLPIVNIERTF